MIFRDRQHAGELLADKLRRLISAPAVVFGIPRGGVEVASVVANALHLPLDVAVARKIGAPSNPEFALGAVTGNGTCWIDDEAVVRLGVAPELLQQMTLEKEQEAHMREQQFRGNRPLPPLEGKTAIVVDDGVATGSTARAVVKELRDHSPKSIVLAAPVMSEDTQLSLQDEVDEIVAVEVDPAFMAVGQYYQEFPQVSDEEVMKILRDEEVKR